jgi:hypothetical protein
LLSQRAGDYSLWRAGATSIVEGSFFLQSRRRVRRRAEPSASHKLRDDRLVPVICPTCQNLFTQSLKHQYQQHYFTLHGVVFDIFGFGQAPLPPKEKAPPFDGAFLLSLGSGSN